VSAAEFMARLAAAGQKLSEAQAKAAAAAQDANEARSLVAGALEGAAAGQLISAIDSVRDNLSRAAGTVGPAQQGVQETISRVRALGN
jgi:predicted ATPase